jgi:pseudouridine-5'-phosphate glycosidase
MPREREIHASELTPFLLQRISELTKGKSMRANLSLLLNNAGLARRSHTPGALLKTKAGINEWIYSE